MGKRGNLAFKFLMILTISAILLILYPKVAESFAKGELAKKTIAAREIALLLDTMYSYPYTMTIDYDINLMGFTLEISDQTVAVYDTKLGKTIDPSLANYRFFTTRGDNPKFTIENSKKIRFKKINDKIEVSKLQ